MCAEYNKNGYAL